MTLDALAALRTFASRALIAALRLRPWLVPRQDVPEGVRPVYAEVWDLSCEVEREGNLIVPDACDYRDGVSTAHPLVDAEQELAALRREREELVKADRRLFPRCSCGRPVNTRADGVPKSREEVRADVNAEMRAWEREPIEPCAPRAKAER